jgi:hypothetical protein
MLFTIPSSEIYFATFKNLPFIDIAVFTDFAFLGMDKNKNE